LTELTFDIDSVFLIGTATSDPEIAKFEVALRKLASFEQIHLGTVKGPDNKREFDISLVYKVIEPTPTGGTGK